MSPILPGASLFFKIMARSDVIPPNFFNYSWNYLALVTPPASGLTIVNYELTIYWSFLNFFIKYLTPTA
jgi:hypothetical protein